MIVLDNRPAGSGTFAQLPQNPTWQQVRTLFKLAVDETLGWVACPTGQACWKFAGVAINDGVAVYRVEVWDATGMPAPNILVLRNYSSAPKFTGPILPAYYPNGEAGFTEAGGDKYGAREFGYGGSSVTGPNGGPDAFWVSVSPNGQPPQFSDLARGFGWLGGTNHLNPSPIFQYVVKEAGGPAVVTGHYILANIGPDGNVIGYIPFIDGAPSTPGPGYLAILRDGLIVGRQEWQTE